MPILINKYGRETPDERTKDIEGDQMIKNLIFDFDGVIADSHDINWGISGELDTTATYEDFLAHHDGNVFEEPRIKFTPEGVSIFYAEYGKRLKPSHIQSSVESLQRLGSTYTLYIISSNSQKVISEILNTVGILPLFARILGPETHKSKIEKFKMLIQDNGVTPENAIFITDTLGDIREAHKVGIRTIAETFGFHNRERLEKGNPFKIVDSWAEIEEVLATL